MENIMEVNSLKLECLRPLGKWRILDIKSLMELSDIPLAFTTFHKVILRFEKAKVIHSFKDPWTKRKMVYLEGLGNGLLGLERPTVINNETLLHDSKVAKIGRAFLQREIIKEVFLEHELSRKHFSIGELAPDAIINGIKNNIGFKLALELELTRKNSERVIEKVKQYLNAGHIDYVLYMFCSENLYQCYLNFFKEKLPIGWETKIMLFVNKTLMSSCFEIEKSTGVFKDKNVEFKDIF